MISRGKKRRYFHAFACQNLDKEISVMAMKNQPGSKESHVILGIHVTGRTEHVPGMQAVLTEYGANIKTRLGLHEVHEGFCSPNGLLLIEFAGDIAQCDALSARLSAVEGVEVKRMVFDHP
jgi:hypothetical protein